MRIKNTENTLIKMRPEIKEVDSSKSALRPVSDQFVRKAKSKSKNTNQSNGFGFLKAFTMANLAVAGGFGALPRAGAYPAWASCPPGTALQATHTVEIPLNIGPNFGWGPCKSPALLAEFAGPIYSSQALAHCRNNAASNGASIGILGFCDDMVFKGCGQEVNVWLQFLGQQWFCEPTK